MDHIMTDEQKGIAEKVWLRSTLYIILKSDSPDHAKVSQIMQMVEAYQAMLEDI